MDSHLAYCSEDLLRFVDCLGGALVPGTDAVVYVANTLDGSTASDSSALWLVEAGQHRRLVHSDAGQARPAVSPDGSLVAFLQQTGTAPDDPWQLAVCARTGGEATVLTEFARGTGQAGPVWSPDGRWLAVDACDLPRRDPARAYRVTRLNWRLDGLGLIDDALGDVWVVPSAGVTGGQPRRLTADDGVISFLEWSPDGASILYGTFGAGDDPDYAIRAVEVASGEARTITGGPLVGDASVAAWAADGKVVYASPWMINNRIELVVCDPRDGTHESRMPDPEGQLFADMVAGFDVRAMAPRIVVDAAGEWAYVHVQQGGALRATRVALAGEVRVEPLTDVSESVVPVGIDGARLLAIATSHTRPADLVVIDALTGQSQAVTELNGTWLTDLPFDVHHLAYPTADGRAEIEGWYLAPRDGTGPYPTVLHLHGGPFAAHGEIFNVDNLLLASAGYGVLMVNFRGSSGYGDAHADMLAGGWGRYELADVLQAVDVAVGQGLADSTRVASFGLSSGGWLTAWLLTHSDRFRAGIAECLLADWTGMLGSDKPALVAASMDGSPGHGPDSMEPYVRMSPVTYAARCSAPLLILEHEDDRRCPPSQGDVLYNELKLAGKVTEMVRLPGVPHDPFGAELAMRVQRAEAIIEWMDRWVKPAAG
jgi:dipeptidyl aminopeptidase/acylaminoacyl peptidase